MLGSSYYDGLNNLFKNNNEDKALQNKSSILKLSTGQYNEVTETTCDKYSTYQLCQKLKADMPKLERFIKDKEYRENLLNSPYPSQDYHELFDLYGLEKIVKEKIGIPENATIKYEKIKCSKDCIHAHQYFYAYYWDSCKKKLKKKYIGKQLPEPFKFKITYSIE